MAPVHAAPHAYDFRDPLWDDGYAEMSRYRAELVIYGKPRVHEVQTILVKEDLDPKSFVKSDRPAPDSIAALKFAYHAVVQTENYPYDFYVASFHRRDQPSNLVRVVANAHEWCGNTYRLFRGWTDPPEYEWHSYFDSEGDGRATLPSAAGATFEDQLSIVLRTLPLEPGRSALLRVLPSLLTNRHREPVLRSATATVVARERRSEIGADAWRVDVAIEGGATHRYWLDARPPNVLVAFESSDGRKLSLLETKRAKYWERPMAVKDSR